jgi:hypothetical protein
MYPRSGQLLATPHVTSRPQEPADALEGLGQLVLKSDQNLIIWRQDSAALAREAQALQDFWCARAPEVAVEHFRGDQRLALLSHINQGIAQLGLEKAMQTPLPSSLPKQIGIITNAEHLLASDVQMLQDLSSHLPGLSWRWVLLGLGHPDDQTSAPVASRPPKNLQSQQMTAPAATEPVAPSMLAESPILASPSPTPQASLRTASGLSSKGLVRLAVATLLSLGAWGTWFHFSGPNTAPSQADERLAAAGPAPALHAPPMPSESAPLLTDSSATTPPSKDKDRVASTDPAAPAAMPQASAAAATSVEVPEIAMRGARWLAQQSPEFFVLEHGVFETAAQAQSLIRSRDELANARVLMRKTNYPGGRFVVITGPFRSQDRAQNYKVRENLPSQIQAREITDVLQETERGTPPRP